MSETSQKIEALIFASSKPVSENEIKKRLDIHEDISEVMSNLESAYQHRRISSTYYQSGNRKYSRCCYRSGYFRSTYGIGLDSTGW
jgi:chromosome segregation and condensation protein ScpB